MTSGPRNLNGIVGSISMIFDIHTFHKMQLFVSLTSLLLSESIIHTEAATHRDYHRISTHIHLSASCTKFIYCSSPET